MASCPAGATTVDLVVDIVAQRLDVTRADIVGPGRSAQATRARHVAMWLARRVAAASTNEIGRAIGGRDHTTVLAAIARINALALDDVVAARELHDLEAEARATAGVYARLGLRAAPDVDAVAVARRVLGDARAATQTSVAEIEALAAYVLTHAYPDTKEEAA